MKLKCKPEDFIVTELTDRRPTNGGFCLFRLSKQGIGTLEALQIFQRSRNIAASQVCHGGLKDRHALTSQFLTVRNGPRSDFDHEAFRMEYLGQTDQPFGAEDILGNRFEIVVRSLQPQEARQLVASSHDVAQHGFPNYFDDQRFGSMGASNEFIAAKWCLKDYEQSLWLAMAEHNRHDDAAERQQKKILRDLWGQWAECKQQLSRSHRRSIVTYLVDHPEGFKKAFALINEKLRGLYLSAFQSAVWNRMLSLVIDNTASAANVGLRRIKIGDTDLPFPNCGIDIAELPLPSARCKGLSAETRNLCEQALKPYNMTLPQMKLSFPRDRWFSRGLRNTLIKPTLGDVSIDNDEMFSGRHSVTLKFDLPRGSYATMLIKVLTESIA